MNLYYDNAAPSLCLQ